MFLHFSWSFGDDFMEIVSGSIFTMAWPFWGISVISLTCICLVLRTDTKLILAVCYCIKHMNSSYGLPDAEHSTLRLVFLGLSSDWWPAVDEIWEHLLYLVIHWPDYVDSSQKWFNKSDVGKKWLDWQFCVRQHRVRGNLEHTKGVEL